MFLHSILPTYQPMLDVYPDIIRNRVIPTAQRRLDFMLTINENHKFLFVRECLERLKFLSDDLEKRSILLQMPVLTKHQIPLAIGMLCIADRWTRY